jgi:2-keto-3-deoxy-L-rhamnonate aldolase RhmA
LIQNAAIERGEAMDGTLKIRLGEGGPLIGTLISLPNPEAAEICAAAGFDWLFLDWEHGLFDVKSLQAILQAVGGKCPCVIRVPENEAIWIQKALDTGADGVIIPHVNNAGDAQKAARSVKYPPEGVRSIGVARAQGYGPDIRGSIERDNQRTVLIVQAEHIEAVRDIDKILDVPGVDAVFIGPFDLSASMNKPGLISDDDVLAAIGRVLKAGQGKGIPMGIFAPDVRAAKKAAEEGFALICVGTDAMTLATAMRGVVQSLKS